MLAPQLFSYSLGFSCFRFYSQKTFQVTFSFKSLPSNARIVRRKQKYYHEGTKLLLINVFTAIKIIIIKVFRVVKATIDYHRIISVQALQGSATLKRWEINLVTNYKTDLRSINIRADQSILIFCLLSVFHIYITLHSHLPFIFNGLSTFVGYLMPKPTL